MTAYFRADCPRGGPGARSSFWWVSAAAEIRVGGISGGITGSRGHAGDNAGRTAILALLHRETSGRDGSFVFGCSLFASDNQYQPQEARPHVHTGE